MMHEVQSSNIHAIGYDPETKTLQVEYKSGKLYQYSEVSQFIFDQLMAAESKGGYMNLHVIGNYPVTRLI